MGTRSISQGAATYLPNVEDRKRLIDIKESLTGLAEESQRMIDQQFGSMSGQIDFPVAMLKVSKGKAVFVAPYNTKLTTQDAADYLGISRPTLVKLLEQGDVPFTKIGRHRRVLLSDLQQYAETRHRDNMKTFDDVAEDENPSDTLDNPLVS